MILIFRHVDCEGPGYLLDFLSRHQQEYRLIAIDQSEPVPGDLTGVSGLVFMGGGMSVNDDLPWIAEEVQLIKQALARDIPVLGHCLGAQLMARALDARVYANPVQEIGWLQVDKVLEDKEGDYPQDFLAFHWHGETFDLPPGSHLLYSSQHCPHQAFAYGKSIAVQFHVEMTADMVHEWCNRFAEQLVPASATVQSAEDILTELETRIDSLQRAADQIYIHWLNGFN